MRRSRTTLVAALAGTALVLTACGGDDAEGVDQDMPTDLESLVEQAHEEGTLNLVWGESIEGGSAAFPELLAGFQAYYGLDDVDVRYTPGPSMPQLASTIAQEVQAGQAPTSDIYVGYGHIMAGVLNEGYEPFRTLDWSWAENVTEDSMGADGMAVVMETNLPVISYNTDVVQEAPQTLAELAQPNYPYVIGSTPYAGHFDILAADAMWGEEEVLSFLQPFSDNVSSLLRCHEPEALTSGQIDVFAIDCAQDSAMRASEERQPIDWTVPSDAAMVVYVYGAVPQTSESPALAQLWINYMLSREAQDVLWDTTRIDSALIEGSNMAGLIETEEAEGTEFQHFPLDDVLEDGFMPDGAVLTEIVDSLATAE